MAGLAVSKPIRTVEHGKAIKKADNGLFSAKGPFECYPGAVVLMGRNSQVIAANDLAETIVNHLRGGESNELRSAVEAALAGRAAQINPLLIESPHAPNSLGQAFDAVVLPWGEGVAALILGRDITVERNLRWALIESRERFKDLVALTGDFVWETDAEGHFTFVVPNEVLGYSAGQMTGQRVEDFLFEGANGTPFSAKDRMHNVLVDFRGDDGSKISLCVSARPIFTSGGVWQGARGIGREEF